MKKEDEKRLGLERGTHRGHVSSEFPFALRMSGRLYTVVGENKRESAPFLAENSQCAFMASTESEDWTVEEDGEPAGVPVASTTSARATSSDREEEEEDDEQMADEGYGVEEEEQQQQEEAALGSPEEVRVAAASDEDSDLVQTETTEGEDGYEAAEEDDQDTVDLEEEGEGERSGEVDSQVEAASAGEWDYGDGERFVGEATPEPASPAPASPQGEGEAGGEAVVTQRDEEIENYQSTVKELTAAVIEREQKIGAHQLESTALFSFFLHTVVYVLCITLSFSLFSNFRRYS